MAIIKISSNCYVPEANIEMFCSYDTSPIKSKVRFLKEKNRIYDMTCGRKTLSVIFLKNNGGAILSPISIDTLNNRMAPKEG